MWFSAYSGILNTPSTSYFALDIWSWSPETVGSDVLSGVEGRDSISLATEFSASLSSSLCSSFSGSYSSSDESSDNSVSIKACTSDAGWVFIGVMCHGISCWVIANCLKQ